MPKSVGRNIISLKTRYFWGTKKHKRELSKPVGDHNSTKCNGPWKDIIEVINGNEKYKELYREGWRMCIADEKSNRDKLQWMHSANGQYSVMFFIDAATSKIYGVLAMKHVYDGIWQGLVQPRVELTTWFILLEAVYTKDNLFKGAILDLSEVQCAFCGGASETVVGIRRKKFGACDQTKRVVEEWMYELGKKGVKMVITKNSDDTDLQGWWLCVKYIEEIGAYSVGGYLVDKNGSLACYMGGLLDKGSTREGTIYYTLLQICPRHCLSLLSPSSDVPPPHASNSTNFISIALLLPSILALQEK
ncbi:hypothetical protein PIB30_065858 [Stylosanthes scabra]|uniref:Uncharacterized protein n=1 Tax=Stylosanthes scabra TaxID=79078 RepID=A0ABU6ZKY3_9FABA|nr:hypothetical protein [Stylosanthes scabra]